MEDSSRARLSGLLLGFMPSQLVHVMARLGIAEQLLERPLNVEELGSATGAHPDALRRLVRGLAAVGLVELDDDEISLTEMGELLATGEPGSMHDAALHFGGEAFRAWSELEHSVRTGEPAFERALGDAFFAYLERHSDAGRAFDGTMTGLSRGVIAQAVEAYDFTAASRILDIGGGRGHFVAALLEAHPQLEGAVFDQPHVGPRTAELLQSRQLQDRCAVVGGSFFASLPSGYDLHLLKWILHDWNDERCGKILAASREALPADGRLLVVEYQLPDEIRATAVPPPAIASDLNMLVNFGDALERSLDQYETLFANAGFALREVVPLPSGYSLMDCRPQR